MRIIKRDIEKQLLRVASQFPIVTILGPRQSGKTTLARNVFPNHEYINLELPSVRQAAQDDAVGFFATRQGPLILDEIQRVPELLSYIQVMADEHKTKGEFILTGSHQPRLAEGISQSLAGRTGLLALFPCSIAELANANLRFARDEYIYRGFMPGVHFDGIDPDLFYSSYFQTYVERDVRTLINLSNQRQFETFVRLLAGRVGQVVNLHALSNDVGVSGTTLSSWLSVLEASFIVFRLPCYYNNFGKRLIKSPKIFFTEVGLACWLLGIEKISQVARDPLLGGLFENMVVIEAMKTRLNFGRTPNLYYFRDQRGMEIDLLIESARKLLPIEIKSAMTYDLSFARNLLSFRQIAKQASSPTVVFAGEQKAYSNDVLFINYRDLANLIVEWDHRDKE